MATNVDAWGVAVVGNRCDWVDSDVDGGIVLLASEPSGRLGGDPDTSPQSLRVSLLNTMKTISPLFIPPLGNVVSPMPYFIKSYMHYAFFFAKDAL